MEFRFYFLKEGTRIYEKTDLITYLVANPNITPSERNGASGPLVFTYHHHVLNFEAKFVMSDKAVIPHIEKLSPKYFDVNFYVEFDVLLSDYACEILLDIIEEICKRFRFLVFNQALEDVISFRRPYLIKTFSSWKKAYADRYPEAVAKFNNLDPQALSMVYGYLQKRKRLELTMENDKINITNYIFLHTDKSRSAYVGIKWDGEHAFILPPAVDIMLLDDGKVLRYIPMAEIMSKAEKMFQPIDGYGDIQLLDQKYTKKLHKILSKEKFAPLAAKLDLLSIDRILDI